MYDLLIRGGRALDPSSELDGFVDIAVTGDRIGALLPAGTPAAAVRSVDVGGRLVTPGLIDLHVHVLEGVHRNSMPADAVGVLAGVTTVVDAGSAGSATFGAMTRHVIPRARTDIFPFVHIGQTGIATRPDIVARQDISVADTIDVIRGHADRVVGVKVRMVTPAIELLGAELPRLAREAARESATRLMVHIGDTELRGDPSAVRGVLPLLQEGDIVTHLFTGNPGGVLDAQGRVFPEVLEAADRGVWMDSAHGVLNFDFDTAKRVLDQGVRPDCISTDLTVAGSRQAVFSLTEVMAQFLALGFSLADVVTMTTASPARAIGRYDSIGRLAVGYQADLTVLDVRAGDWISYDARGTPLEMDTALVPYATVKRGELISPEWGPHPWGWEPLRRGPDGLPNSDLNYGSDLNTV